MSGANAALRPLLVDRLIVLGSTLGVKDRTLGTTVSADGGDTRQGEGGDLEKRDEEASVWHTATLTAGCDAV